MVNSSLLKRNIAKSLANWYALHKRDLPWRIEKTPYVIWLSEIVLQQTRVQQGLPYFQRILKRYPTVRDLAASKEEDLLKWWEGLGYYSRARNMHRCAQQLLSQYGGVFPSSVEELQQLPGIGPYTAAAISSFAFNKEIAVVDGNVYRLLSRLFGITYPIDATKSYLHYHAIAQDLLSHSSSSSALHNQAMMEFGALQCRPSPNCIQCPLQRYCIAYQKDQIALFPFRGKKVQRKQRYFHYLLFSSPKGGGYLKKRIKKDIWQGLYDFYLVETDQPIAMFQQLEDPLLNHLVSLDIAWKELYPGKSIQYLLTHQQLWVRFFCALTYVSDTTLEKAGLQWVSSQQLEKLPLPRLLNRYKKDWSLAIGI